MVARSPVPPEKRLSQEAINILLIHFIFTVGLSMAGVFLNLYLWRLSENLMVNAYYHLIFFAVSWVSFGISGWFVKKRDRIMIYRLGIALVSLFYLSVIVVRENLVQYYTLFAVLQAFVMAFYWIGYLTLMYDVSNEHNRMRFLALNLTIFTLGTLSGPLIAGNIIHYQEGLRGYTIVFSIATLMFMIATRLSFKIPSLQLPPKPMYIRQTITLILKNRIWQKSLLSFTVIGTFQGLMIFLPNILLYRFVPREDLIGYLGMMYSSMTIIMSMINSRIAQPEKSKLYITIAACLTITGSVILWFNMSLWSVIIFMSLYSLSVPLQWNSLTTNYFAIISNLPLRGNMRVESMVVREGALNTGRFFAVLLLIVCINDLSSQQLPLILIGISLIQFVNVFIFKQMKSKSKSTV